MCGDAEACWAPTAATSARRAMWDSSRPTACADACPCQLQGRTLRFRKHRRRRRPSSVPQRHARCHARPARPASASTASAAALRRRRPGRRAARRRARCALQGTFARSLRAPPPQPRALSATSPSSRRPWTRNAAATWTACASRTAAPAPRCRVMRLPSAAAAAAARTPAAARRRGPPQSQSSARCPKRVAASAAPHKRSPLRSQRRQCPWSWGGEHRGDTFSGVLSNSAAFFLASFAILICFAILRCELAVVCCAEVASGFCLKSWQPLNSI